MKVRLRATVLLGSVLMASISLGGAGVPSAVAAAPAGYAPGSPAGTEYQEQLATAREIGTRDGGGSEGDGGSSIPSARPDDGPPLFGAGVTAGAGIRGKAGVASGDTPAAGGGGSAGARSAIAAAARAPLEGPSSALVTGLLGLVTLLVTGLLALLLRRDGHRSLS